jgi:hypothetical protein
MPSSAEARDSCYPLRQHAVIACPTGRVRDLDRRRL